MIGGRSKTDLDGWNLELGFGKFQRKVFQGGACNLPLFSEDGDCDVS